MIKIFTDGGNVLQKGVGAWAFAVFQDDTLIHSNAQKVDKFCLPIPPEYEGVDLDRPTNNQMELMAMLQAFKWIVESGVPDEEIMICFDSEYAHGSIDVWKLTPDKKNYELIKNAIAYYRVARQNHIITWLHVPGHSGIAGNELVDSLCTKAMNGEPIGQVEVKQDSWTVEEAEVVHDLQKMTKDQLIKEYMKLWNSLKHSG